jgi:4a-hydroxytetrahydrobiopterin dehydratase
MSLADKKCIPCEGGVKPFTKQEINRYLPQLKSNWQVIEGNKKLQLKFKVKDFMTAIGIINQAAEIAEKEYHHPDLAITSYKFVTFTIYTHKINGLWESDFILAAKLEKLIP